MSKKHTSLCYLVFFWFSKAKICGKIPIQVKNEPQIGSSLWQKARVFSLSRQTREKARAFETRIYDSTPHYTKLYILKWFAEGWHSHWLFPEWLCPKKLFKSLPRCKLIRTWSTGLIFDGITFQASATGIFTGHSIGHFCKASYSHFDDRVSRVAVKLSNYNSRPSINKNWIVRWLAATRQGEEEKFNDNIALTWMV
jgi:hypothetical protein